MAIQNTVEGKEDILLHTRFGSMLRLKKLLLQFFAIGQAWQPDRNTHEGQQEFRTTEQKNSIQRPTGSQGQSMAATVDGEKNAVVTCDQASLFFFAVPSRRENKGTPDRRLTMWG